MPETHQAADAITIGDIYYLLFRHKWIIIIFSLLGCLASLVVLFRTPGVYESEAALLVRYVSDTTVMDVVATGERITTPGRGGENIINSEIAILSSRDLTEKVIDEMGISRFTLDSTNALDRALIAENVVSAIKIVVPKNSNVIRIAFDAPTPTAAQEFLRRLTESYLQKHIDIHRASGTYEFLAQQTDQLRSRLSETEEELRKLKYSEGIVSIEESKRSAAQRTEELTKGLDELETALAAAKARAEVMRPLLAATGGSLTTVVSVSAEVNEATPALRARLLRLQQKETELMSSYTADSFPVKSIHEQIAETRRLLEGEKPSVTTSNVVSSSTATNYLPVLVEEQANIAALQAKLGVQRELLNRVLVEAKKVDSVEARIVQLQRSKELQEANYKYFCQSLEHARIDEALTSGRISNISIVQPATLPSRKLRPNLLRNMGMALVVGIVCGLGLAVVQEYVIDHTIRKPGELPGLFSAPVVMSMPRLVDAGNLLPAGNRRVPLLLNAHEGDQVEAGKEAGVGWTELRDLYDALRDRLLTLIGPNPEKMPYVVGITSCAKGSGVSTIAAGLAVALARNGDQRVVLLDANSEMAASTIFGINPTTGLVEIIPDGEGNARVTQHSFIVAPTGDVEPRPVYASPAHRFAAMIQYLRGTKTGFIVIDLPPVKEPGLTLRIGRLLDGVVLVIASEKVNRHVAGHAKELLMQADAKIIGSILNKHRQYVPDWLYSS